MNTSELLVLIFVFLVGYMLFKRCGCIEGVGGNNSPKLKIPFIDYGNCIVKANLRPFIDADKLTRFINNEGTIDGNTCDKWNRLSAVLDFKHPNGNGLFNPDKTKLCHDLYNQGLYNQTGCSRYFTANSTPTPS